MTLPARYAYLSDLPGAPRMLVEGLALYGVTEKVGPENNPVIMGWAREVGLEDTYRADAVPWCGLYMAVVAKRAGWSPVAAPLWALNWRTFGAPADKPSIGDVMAFVRPSGGHVGIYVGEDISTYHILGGNQGDAVSIIRIARDRLRGARRPVWRISQPAGVTPWRVDGGGPVSVNEA